MSVIIPCLVVLPITSSLVLAQEAGDGTQLVTNEQPSVEKVLETTDDKAEATDPGSIEPEDVADEEVLIQAEDPGPAESEKTKEKKGLSTMSMVGLGVGAAALVGIAVAVGGGGGGGGSKSTPLTSDFVVGKWSAQGTKLVETEYYSGTFSLYAGDNSTYDITTSTGEHKQGGGHWWLDTDTKTLTIANDTGSTYEGTFEAKQYTSITLNSTDGRWQVTLTKI